MEMMEKLRALDLHYADVEARLSAPETYEDPALVARLNKEQRELEPVVMAYRAYQRRRQDLEDAEALMGDPDMKELAQEEYQQAREELARLEEEIKVLLLPRDPNDDKNVIVEIRAGVGVFIYQNLSGNQSKRLQPASQEIGVYARRNTLYNMLPETFTKKDYDATVLALGENGSTANKWIEAFIKDSKLCRIEQGKYRKIF